jgi:hypothetical protein
MTNTLAYCVKGFIVTLKRLMIQENVITLFIIMILTQCSVVIIKLLILHVEGAWARVGSWPYPQTLDCDEIPGRDKHSNL